MENITKKSNYSEKTMFFKMDSSTRESLETSRTNLEERLTNLGGELVARKSKNASGAYESVIAIYFENTDSMSRAMDELRSRAPLRSDKYNLQMFKSFEEKNEISKKYFKQGAEELVNDYVYDTRWD
jgi:hypothetical protein